MRQPKERRSATTAINRTTRRLISNLNLVTFLGLGFGQKLGWEMGFEQNLGWEMGFVPPPSGPSLQQRKTIMRKKWGKGYSTKIWVEVSCSLQKAVTLFQIKPYFFSYEQYQNFKQTFSSFKPFPSLPSTATDDSKQLQCSEMKNSKKVTSPKNHTYLRPKWQ